MALVYKSTVHLPLGPGGQLLPPGTVIEDSGNRDLARLIAEGKVFLDDTSSGGADTDITVTPNTVAASGATEELDGDEARYHEVTLDANCTITVANLGDGEKLTLVVEQDGTGGHTLTIDSLTDAGADVLAGLTTTAGAIAVLVLLQTSHGLMVFVTGDAMA